MTARNRWIHIGCLGLGMLTATQAVYAADGNQDASSAPTQTDPAHLQGVEVISTVPLPGLGTPLNQVPSNVQTANGKDLQQQQSLDLEDYLNNNFSGVNVNESQNNPFQPDVNYHGFTASPLLGTPQGLSVYQDGVRVNESFGDTVNWDLIPESSIANITLIPGSNPVFGLNTLGGALSIQTKNGRDNPGNEVEFYGGSNGRTDIQGQTGGTLGHFDYFFTGNYFHEYGWRDFSPSLVRQAFGKVGWQDDDTSVHVSYNWANNLLIGNGVTPEDMLNNNYAAIYTAPDLTRNSFNFVNVTGSHSFNDTLLLSGNVYYRQLVTLAQNGDDSDDNYENDEGGFVPPAGLNPPDCSNAPSGNTTDDKAANAYCANAINRYGHLTQRSFGAGLQLTESHDIFGLKNQAILGLSFSRSRDSYSQIFQYATLTDVRSAISNPTDTPQVVNNIYGTSQIEGLYVTDTLSPTSFLHLIASARYNRDAVTLNGTSVNTSLDDYGDGFNDNLPIVGEHTFHRINPALGFTITPNKALTFYADYNEGSRAPTVIELGCADPDEPCGLPNSFASDPKLEQVVARTLEAGARGTFYGKWLNWSVDAYRTRSANDIQYVAASTSEGYFQNVGDTRRQGFDLGLGGKFHRLTWRLVYSFVDATYQSSFTEGAESNSTQDADGFITVQPGNRIPLIPRSTGRLILSYAVTNKWNVGANVIMSAGSFLRGNENNATQIDPADGYLGSGRIGGYTVINMNTDYRVAPNVVVFARLVNVLDKKYATAGFLSGSVFNAQGQFTNDGANQNAISPAQPRAIWVGARVSF